MGKSMDQALMNLIDVFINYSINSGDEFIFRKRNLKELIQNEMNVGPILQKPEYRTLMADLERNKNERVDFAESVAILRRVLITEGTTSN